MTVAGSNTTMSASAPSVTRPLLRIAGTWPSSSRAGSRLHLASAPASSSGPPSRVSSRSDRPNVPAVLGWVNAAGGSGQEAGSGASQADGAARLHVSGIASLATTVPGKRR